MVKCAVAGQIPRQTSELQGLQIPNEYWNWREHLQNWRNTNLWLKLVRTLNSQASRWMDLIDRIEIYQAENWQHLESNRRLFESS